MQRGCGIVHRREVWAGSLPDADQSLNGGVWLRMGQTRIRQDPATSPVGTGSSSRLKSWGGRRMVLAATYRERIPAEARLRLRRDCPPLFLLCVGRLREHAVVRDVSARVVSN